MTTNPVVRWLTWLAIISSLVGGCVPARLSQPSATSPLASHTTDPALNQLVSVVPLIAGLPTGWSAIERRVYRGVCKGVASFRFGLADREDTIAIAMERAWRAYRSTAEPIRNPEGWGMTIATRASIDELRRQRRDLLCLTSSNDAEAADRPDLIEHPAALLPSPLERVAEAERGALLRQRVLHWPSTERDLALLVLDGQADTITAAAWLFREQQEARGEPGTMYPQKARFLLDARRGELEDLV